MGQIFMGAPRRQRQSVERNNIFTRARGFWQSVAVSIEAGRQMAEATSVADRPTGSKEPSSTGSALKRKPSSSFLVVIRCCRAMTAFCFVAAPHTLVIASLSSALGAPRQGKLHMVRRH